MFRAFKLLFIFFTADGPLNLKLQCMMKIRGILAPSLVDHLPLPEALKQEMKRVPMLHCELQQSTTQQSSSDIAVSQLSSTIKDNCINENREEVGQNLNMDCRSPKQSSCLSPTVKQSSHDETTLFMVEKT